MNARLVIAVPGPRGTEVLAETYDRHLLAEVAKSALRERSGGPALDPFETGRRQLLAELADASATNEGRPLLSVLKGAG